MIRSLLSLADRVTELNITKAIENHGVKKVSEATAIKSSLTAAAGLLSASHQKLVEMDMGILIWNDSKFIILEPGLIMNQKHSNISKQTELHMAEPLAL